MGIAAYNRGSALIRRQMGSRRPVAFEIMDRLNALERYPNAGTPWGPVIFVNAHKGWWVECAITGFGYWYKTLDEAVKRWHVNIVGMDGPKWLAEPRHYPVR